jgi:hypothetical protein
VGRRRLASRLAVFLLVLALAAAAWPTTRASAADSPAEGDATMDVPALADLRGATAVTPASHVVSAAISNQASVDAAFQPYYDSHAGPQLLGEPLTPAFLTREGLAQFFVDGELVLHPAARTSSALGFAALGDAAPQDAGGIEWRPLLGSLLQLGSTAAIDDDSGSLTYLDLRRAALAAPLMSAAAQAANARGQLKASAAASAASVFVASMGSGDKALGQLVPTAIWAYLQRDDVSPQGWQASFGVPLTGAIPMIATVGGTLHRELVQVFARGAVVLDAATGDDVHRLATGLDYLETVGLPAVVVRSQTLFWAARDTVIRPAPASGDAEVHLGQHFPVTFTGESAWVEGALWYHVVWQTPGRSGDGWMAAADGTLVAPGPDSPPQAGFDLLSADLEHYLEQHGDRVGAVVFDETRDAYYEYNPADRFTVASSVKVPIMLTFLAMTERQGREPSDAEMALLTTMIENSNNDSAQALWVEVGGGAAVASYLQAVGVDGFQPDNADGWGWSRISPLAMVRLLTLLHDGKVLTAPDRQTALYLMGHIESDEQTGVGDTAPAGATVEMKDGWVPGPDGLWVMNTSGIVSVGGETYIISVYTQDDDSLDDGWGITRYVCQAVAGLLT